MADLTAGAAHRELENFIPGVQGAGPGVVEHVNVNAVTAGSGLSIMFVVTWYSLGCSTPKSACTR